MLSDGATTNSLWDGIAFWELQEQKGQQRVCKHSDVVQPTQVGCMVHPTVEDGEVYRRICFSDRSTGCKDC